jgi:hypothetical protein
MRIIFDTSDCDEKKESLPNRDDDDDDNSPAVQG